jgi:hypothetical protein
MRRTKRSRRSDPGDAGRGTKTKKRRKRSGRAAAGAGEERRRARSSRHPPSLCWSWVSSACWWDSSTFFKPSSADPWLVQGGLSPEAAAMQQSISWVTAVLSLIWGAVVTLGGVKMLQLQSRGSVIVATIFAMLPCNPVASSAYPSASGRWWC